VGVLDEFQLYHILKLANLLLQRNFGGLHEISTISTERFQLPKP
jgi:hypothetical protein